MKAKEELLRFVFDNEFITKPRLKNEFELLLNRVIEEAQQQLKNCNLQNVSNNEALELCDGVAFANYIEEKWKEYRTFTNNEDAWCFKQWLVGK